MSETTKNTHSVPISSIDAQWADYFRYITIYKDQKTGIEEFLETLNERGFYSLEGPCGTGKTLIGVTAALHAMRSGAYPEYSETCVLTPNKQQLKQFITEMRGVNSSLPENKEPAKTVVMKGRTDMMPYSFTDIHPFKSGSFNNTVDKLKRNARKAMSFDSDIPLDWPRNIDPPESARYDFDWNNATQDQIKRRNNNAYDPIRAKAIKQIIEDLVESNPDYEHLTVDGITTPYPDVVPHTRHIVSESELEKQGKNQLPMELQGLFDPFYVGFCAEGFPTFGFADADEYVFDREILFSKCAEQGICPHETMVHFGKKADFILGNYMHFFDPLTRNLTVDKMELFSESTITILDEAHRIEDKVRDMLSETLDVYTIDKTIADLEYTEAYFGNTFSKTPTPSPTPDEIEAINEAVKEAKSVPDNKEVTEDQVSECIELFEFLKQKLLELSADYLNNELEESWMRKIEDGTVQDEEYALSSPELPNAEDRLLRTVTSRLSNGEKRMKNAIWVIRAVNELFEQLDDRGVHTREPQEEIIGDFCWNWVEKDGIDYHREIVLNKSIKDNINVEYPQWIEGWTPKFQLFNCIPTTELQSMFESIGAGLLMSATLSPSDAFQEAVGVNNVQIEPDDNSEESTSTTNEETRPDKFTQFPLRFPEENRDSIIVDIPKFTSKNRGSKTRDRDSMTNIRKKYADIIEDIANTHGNVMICMPKYSEAKWAYDMVKNNTEKDCYLDQSSTNKETNKTLENFFDEDSYNVIFTSTRGTITEGVDYKGDKLHCCAVVGIPLIDTRPKRIEAVEHAYGNRISCDSGFNTAIKIPAVRKTRQAFGRVLRGMDEVGVRILVDERYGSTNWDGANQYLSEQEQTEFEMVSTNEVKQRVETFWGGHN